jgi:hypothetical protein
MAIEWWAKVNRGFSAGGLSNAITRTLADIGFSGTELKITTKPGAGSFGEEVAVEGVPGDMEILASDQPDLQLAISTASGAHSVTLSVQDFGDPSDPELGKWIIVRPWRDNPSIVLSIAAIIAAADLADAHVIDESQLLGSRERTPADLVEAIKQHSAGQNPSLVDGAQSLLTSFQPRLLILDQ